MRSLLQAEPTITPEKIVLGFIKSVHYNFLSLETATTSLSNVIHCLAPQSEHIFLLYVHSLLPCTFGYELAFVFPIIFLQTLGASLTHPSPWDFLFRPNKPSSLQLSSHGKCSSTGQFSSPSWFVFQFTWFWCAKRPKPDKNTDTLICFNSLSIYLAFKCCWLPGRDTCVIAHWNTLTVVHYCFWRDIKRNFGNSLWFKFYLPPITPKLGTVLVQNNLRRFWRQELLNCLLQITVAINAKRNWWISKLKA